MKFYFCVFTQYSYRTCEAIGKICCVIEALDKEKAKEKEAEDEKQEEKVEEAVAEQPKRTRKKKQAESEVE